MVRTPMEGQIPARVVFDRLDPSMVMSLFPLMTTAGAGVLELPRILGHAKKNGVEHFYAEQDLAAAPPGRLVQASATSVRSRSQPETPTCSS